jgi:hypothetical protein
LYRSTLSTCCSHERKEKPTCQSLTKGKLKRAILQYVLKPTIRRSLWRRDSVSRAEHTRTVGLTGQRRREKPRAERGESSRESELVGGRDRRRGPGGGSGHVGRAPRSTRARDLSTRPGDVWPTLPLLTRRARPRHNRPSTSTAANHRRRHNDSRPPDTIICIHIRCRWWHSVSAVCRLRHQDANNLACWCWMIFRKAAIRGRLSGSRAFGFKHLVAPLNLG